MRIETERLILREFIPTDDEGMFELDSNPLVHQYLGNNPITTLEQAQQTIQLIRQQYVDNGIGRYAVIEKESGNFVGWSGLKFVREFENNHVNFYDVGYRLIPTYWGKGYATESAKAALQYGFEVLALNEIYGSANIENTPSRNVLQKCGLTVIEQFYWKDICCDWMKITKTEWLKKPH